MCLMYWMNGLNCSMLAYLLTDYTDYTDFQKAFDTVPHRRLLTKLLTLYGFSGKVFTWIQSFLSE